VRAAEIHARVSWPQVLADLGIPETALRNKPGPCPACGGKDRFRFDNKRGRGDFYCNQCRPGDGFKLLERVYGWGFSEARRRVIEVAGLSDTADVSISAPASHPAPIEPKAIPTDRVRRLRRERCAVADCDDAVTYLTSRELWPLPNGCVLSAHASVDYFEDGQRIGRYAAIVADVVDLVGELVTIHVTHLQNGQKLASHEPRKLFSRMTGREGCAVRLMPAADVLGIAEGIETALSAAVLDGLPVWAAVNTALLAKFEPPAGVKRLILYADRDEPGLTAACRLMERLQGRLPLEVRIPAPPAKDWNDVLKFKRGLP